MTTEERLIELDDEILALSYMEDKLRRAIKREPIDSRARRTMRQQLNQVQARLFSLEREADQLRFDAATLIERRRLLDKLFPPVVPSPLVRFFGIEIVEPEAGAAIAKAA